MAESFKLVLGAEAQRTPFFCSGCPHNTGLLVPDGSLVGAGIGCHGMVSMIGRPQTGEVVSITAMGGEGAQWVGPGTVRRRSPHVPEHGRRHVLPLRPTGDPVRGVGRARTITFKILYNAAVAMTGGQDAAGVRPVPDVAAMLLAEGVKRVVITTDDPAKYRGVSVPRGVDVMHRDRIVEAQEQLRAIDGVTVLIHDQQCAAEKRRERKRGRVKQASFRVMIDERVCEGCGDCGVKSNCLSLHSIDTEFGRKTVVDQASCNIDASCLKGDCPAFVTVAADSITGRSTGAANRPLDPASLPDPARLPASATIRMPGIGGTGRGDRQPGARHRGEAGGQAVELGRPDRPQPEGGSGRVDADDRRADAGTGRRAVGVRPAVVGDAQRTSAASTRRRASPSSRRAWRRPGG